MNERDCLQYPNRVIPTTRCPPQRLANCRCIQNVTVDQQTHGATPKEGQCAPSRHFVADCIELKWPPFEKANT